MHKVETSIFLFPALLSPHPGFIICIIKSLFPLCLLKRATLTSLENGCIKLFPAKRKKKNACCRLMDMILICMVVAVLGILRADRDANIQIKNKSCIINDRGD